MLSNLDRYKKDLDSLLARAEQLHLAMQRECFPNETESALKKQLGDEA